MHIAPLRQLALVTGPLDLLAPQPVHLFQLSLEFLLDCKSNVKRQRRHRLQQQFTDAAVDLFAVDALAQWAAVFDAIFLANIIGNGTTRAAVISDGHAISADAAHYEALQECGPFPRRALFPIAALSLCILPKPLLIGFAAFPCDVAGMHAGDEDPLIS